jgi:hypothetical protein
MIKIKEQKRLVALFFAVMVFDATSANAQSIKSEVKEINTATGVPYTQKIVALNNDTTIAFTQSINGNMPYVFYLTPTPLGITNADVAELVDPNYIVNDVKTLSIGSNNLVFFCGEFKGQGFIARAIITNLFAGGTNAFQCNMIQNSVSIDKIEVFNNTSGIHVVGIGTNVNGQSFFLDSDMSTNGLYYCINQNETLDDLTINNQYVITVGRNNNSQMATDIILRRYDKNNIPAPTNEIAFNFAKSNILHKLHVKTIYNDSIAVVGITDNNTASTLAMIVDATTFGIVKAEYFDGYKYQSIEVRDLTYYPTLKELIILEYTTSQPTATPMDAAIVWDVVANPASSVDIYYGLNMMNTLLLLNGIVEYQPYNFAAIGIDPNTQLVNIWYGDRSITGNFNCNKYVKEALIKAPVSKGSALSVNSMSHFAIWNNEGTNPSIEQVIPNCK